MAIFSLCRHRTEGLRASLGPLSEAITLSIRFSTNKCGAGPNSQCTAITKSFQRPHLLFHWPSHTGVMINLNFFFQGKRVVFIPGAPKSQGAGGSRSCRGQQGGSREGHLVCAPVQAGGRRYQVGLAALSLCLCTCFATRSCSPDTQRLRAFQGLSVG